MSAMEIWSEAGDHPIYRPNLRAIVKDDGCVVVQSYKDDSWEFTLEQSDLWRAVQGLGKMAASSRACHLIRKGDPLPENPLDGTVVYVASDDGTATMHWAEGGQFHPNRGNYQLGE